MIAARVGEPAGNTVPLFVGGDRHRTMRTTDLAGKRATRRDRSRLTTDRLGAVTVARSARRVDTDSRLALDFRSSCRTLRSGAVFSSRILFCLSSARSGPLHCCVRTRLHRLSTGPYPQAGWPTSTETVAQRAGQWTTELSTGPFLSHPYSSSSGISSGVSRRKILSA